MLTSPCSKTIAVLALIPTCILSFNTLSTTSSILKSPQSSLTVLDLHSRSNLDITSTSNVNLGAGAPCLSLLEKDVVSSGPSPSRHSNRANRIDSPLNMICDERREFELNLGKAMDTLKKDYPDMLTIAPDLSIYHDDLDVVDPSGFTIHGKKNYETSFAVVRSFVSWFYCPESSGLTFRIVYDWARNNIRVSWNAVVIPKAIYGGDRNKLHVDGISVYEMDRSSGLITQHRVEHLLVNGNPVHAPKGVFHALTNNVAPGIPVAGGYGNFIDGFKLEFRPHFHNHLSLKSTPGTSLLFSEMKMTSTSTTSDGGDSNFDTAAFKKKNDYRKKYGLPPLSEEEFIRVEAEVKQLATVQQQRQQQAQQQAQQAAATELAEKERKKNGFLNRMMGDIMTDTCESNYDCERPQVCCDFIFKKVCCASGMKVMNGVPGQMQPKRVTIPRLPQGGPDGMPGYY